MRTVCPTRIWLPTATAPVSGIDADDRADQEVAPLVLGLVLVDHDAEEEALGGQGLLVMVEVLDHLAQAVERGLRGELGDDVSLGPGDGHLRPDGRCALRDARQHLDTAEAHRHRALVDHVVVEKEAGGALAWPRSRGRPGPASRAAPR